MKRIYVLNDGILSLSMVIFYSAKLKSRLKYFIISPRIWNGRKPKDVILTIRETTNDGSWTDNIYQELHIVIP